MGAAIIWAGVALALAGIACLGVCILRLRGMRRSGLGKSEFDAAMRRLIALNAAGVGLGFLGLALLVVGIAL